MKKFLLTVGAYALIAAPVPCLLYILGIVGTISAGGSISLLWRAAAAAVPVAIWAAWFRSMLRKAGID